MAEQSFLSKIHLEDGDQIQWYKEIDNQEVTATWHSNGRVDLFDRKDVSICDANFRIIKGHWRTKGEHGVGTEPNHWLFNENKISDYLNYYPDFWKSNEIKQYNSTRKQRKTKTEVIDYEPVKVDDGSWTITDHTIFREAENISSTIKAYEIESKIIQTYSSKELDENMSNSGVYILLNNKKPYYIGQADNIYSRVDQHLKDKHKGKWDSTLIFIHINDDLTKDFQDTLEWRLINEINGRGSSVANNTQGNFRNAEKVYKKHPQQYDEIINRIRESSYKLGYDFLTRGTYNNTAENAIGTIDTNLKKDDSRTDVIITPRWVIEEMLDLLPEEAFGFGTTILDPAIKDGGFIKAIYERCLNNKDLNIRFNYDKRKIGAYVREIKLFGIMQAATKDDYGFDVVEIMRQYISDRHLIMYNYEKVLNNKTDIKQLAEEINEMFGRDKGMKFDVAIGNPPYQEDTGGGNQGGKIIFPYFIDMAYKLGDISSLITPSRYFVDNRTECINTREIMAGGHTIKIVDFKDAKTIFPNVNIAGGVNYYIINKSYNGKCNFISDGEEFECTLDKRIIIRNKYIYNLVSKLDGSTITDNPMNFFNLKRAEKGSLVQLEGQDIKIYGSNDDIGYCERSYISKNEDCIDKYKLVTDYGSGGYLNNNNLRLGKLSPGSVCTLTYYVIRAFDTEQELCNCKKYLSTKFARALIDVTICNATITNKNFILVPNQDFTPNSDIDWSQSISEIDQQLYKKYNLSQEEIDYIEKTIKPMT